MEEIKDRIAKSRIEKWLPLILLGLIGMFLSEFLIWNHALQIIKQHIMAPRIPRAALGCGLTYIFFFLIPADIIQRYKIRDITSILLLGSVYGLVIEGIWAHTVFAPLGLGPRIFGIWLIHLGFTALSWHPLIDFALGFIFLRMILKGRMGLGVNAITSREVGTIAIFSLFWFIWPYAMWFRVPQVPFSIQALTFLYPIILFGILFYFILKRRSGYVPEKILDKKAYSFLIAYFLYFVVKKFFVVQNKASFIFFCFIVIFYVILLVLYITFARGQKPERSIYEESFPITGTFSVTKYLKVSGLIIIFYAVFKVFSMLAGFRPLWLFLTTALAVGFILFSILFPLYAVIRIIWGLIYYGKEKI